VGHCENNAADRKVGEYWERQFCDLATDHGRTITALQIGRKTSASAYHKQNGKWHHRTLPDVTVWTCPGEHHELKHKSPTRHGSIGLEVYRFDALEWFADETQQGVWYTLHRWDRAPGGKGGHENRTEDWDTCSITKLRQAIEAGKCIERRGPSWVNGTKKDVPIYYWDAALWMPLRDLWVPVGVPF